MSFEHIVLSDLLGLEQNNSALLSVLGYAVSWKASNKKGRKVKLYLDSQCNFSSFLSFQLCQQLFLFFVLQAPLYPQCWTAFPQHWTASGPIERNSKPRLPSVALFSPIYLYICYFYCLAQVTPILSYNCSYLPTRSQKINHSLSPFLHFFLALCFLLFLLPPSFPLSSPPHLSFFIALRYNS